jgi:hypothetical protein
MPGISLSLWTERKGVPEYRLPEKIDQPLSAADYFYLLRDQVRNRIAHDRHLIFYRRSKPVVQIPGVVEAEKKARRCKSLLAVHQPGVAAVIIL